MLAKKNICLAIEDKLFGPREVYICLKLIDSNDSRSKNSDSMISSTPRVMESSKMFARSSSGAAESGGSQTEKNQESKTTQDISNGQVNKTAKSSSLLKRPNIPFKFGK